MPRDTEQFDSASDETSHTGSSEEEETSSTSSTENTRPAAADGNAVNGVPASRPGSNAVNTNSANSTSPPLLDAAVAGGRLINNNPMDERLDVHDGDNIATPRALQAPRHHNSSSSGDDEQDDGDSESNNDEESGENHRGQASGGRNVVYNAPHDEAIPIDDSEEDAVATPVANRQPPSEVQPHRLAQAPAQQQERQRAAGAMVPDDDDDDEEEEAEDGEEEQADEATSPQQQYRPNYGGQTPAAVEQPVAGQPVLPNKEYNPAKYARVNAKASREMQELFKRILDYQPFVAELPAKLRPFIPDYIPAVGELDAFVKIPRPDGHPDGLGLYVVDEPAIPQSNPAVVQLELRATNAHVASGAAQVVDSFEDAANRPEVIDRWINDVKKVHSKKALATVSYQKPMPGIDTLLQAWPSTFEDVLNSDVQFPSPGIDLDLDQYVRTLCAILDIPTYSSLIDSLHIMFTLYEEFRGNQHFQHE